MMNDWGSEWGVKKGGSEYVERDGGMEWANKRTNEWTNGNFRRRYRQPTFPVKQHTKDECKYTYDCVLSALS